MREVLQRHPVIAFFALAFAITWGLEALRLALGLPGLSAILALQVAGAGPSLAGLVVAWAAYGRRGLRDLLGRAFKWRVGVGWHLLVLVVFPALLVGVLAAATILSGQAFEITVSWWLLPAFMLVVPLLGPLQEELGWRAFALPALMERHGWLPAGLMIGLAWALWHRTPETWAAITWSEPLGSAGLFGLVLGAVVPDVALSVLMTWVFVRTGGSALVAGLGMHTSANFALYLPAPLPPGSSVQATTWAITLAFAGCLAALALFAALTARRSGTMERLARSPGEDTRDEGRRGF